MSERGGGTMVSDQDIAEALETLLRESNPNTSLTSLNVVVQQLESKLGLNLSHKIEFIRNQIHLLLRPPPPHHQQQLHPQRPPPQQQLPPQLQQHLHRQQQPHQNEHHHHHFALQHQTPNFHPSQLPPNFTTTAHHPEEFVGFRPPVQPQAQQQAQVPLPSPKTEAFVGEPAPTAAPSPSGTTIPELPKDSAQPEKKKRRGGPGGLNKLCGVSPELQAIVGEPKLTRTEIVKQLWQYIRKNNLQDPSNKRKIVCNDELRLVFECEYTDMFKMNKLLVKHIIPLEPTKPTSRNSKKPKLEQESASRSIESVPIVIISDALALFFGTVEREMAQGEVLRRVWEYIKENQLEDPLNAMVIMCDAKLQELLGCGSISALGIPEMLARNHLFKKS